MKTKKCLKCGRSKFAEGSDFILIRTSKISKKGNNKIYTFCLNCEEVDSIHSNNLKKK